MKWPFHKKVPALVYPFRGLTEACKAKDAELYAKLCHHIPGVFWREWQKVYPEDFPLDGMSPPDARSIIPKHKDR